MTEEHDMSMDFPDPLAADEFSLKAPDAQTTLEWLAVLSSQEIDYNLHNDFGEWSIEVSPDEFEKARALVDEYESERDYFSKANRPVETTHPKAMPDSHPLSVYAMAVILIVIFLLSGPYQQGASWFEAGASDPTLMLKGEWWRPITALFLHADIIHLLGNVIMLLCFAVPLSVYLGSGGTCLMVLLSGTVANFVAAWFRSTAAHGIGFGASTAVFAALGLLAAQGFLSREPWQKSNWSWKPLAAAFIILGISGSSPGTDVLAHFLGFVFGVLLGIPGYFLLTKVKSAAVQYGLALLSLLISVTAWYFAAGSIKM